MYVFLIWVADDLLMIFVAATSLPHRPQMAVYKRARILLYRSAERKWTQEEYEIVRRYHKFLLLRSYELYFILSIFMLALLI